MSNPTQKTIADRLALQRRLNDIISYASDIMRTIEWHQHEMDQYCDSTAKRYELVGQVYSFDHDPNVIFHNEMIDLLEKRLEYLRGEYRRVKAYIE